VEENKAFGKYTIKKLLRRQGSYVSIFLGRKEGAVRDVELHVLNHDVSDNTPDFQRFLNEFQTLSNLKHPNIESVSDMGMEDNKAFYATSHSGACPLTEVIDGGKKFTIPEIIEIGRQLTEALTYIHGKKVLHRDLGPETVYYHTPFRRAIISGFALVKNFKLTNLTARGLMTPTEMRVTPEQVEDLPYDERTDIYLLGDLMYWLLTDMPALTMDFNPERITTHNPGCPLDLEEAIMKMLEASPDRRFQTARDAQVALADCAKA
jgi:serine/threonine-protein kinase